jgi:hypothetical protein
MMIFGFISLDAGFFLSNQGALWVCDLDFNLSLVKIPLVHEFSLSVCGCQLLINRMAEWSVSHPSQLLRALFESSPVFLNGPRVYSHVNTL